MAISTNQKPTIYRSLYENTGPELRMGGIRTFATEITLLSLSLYKYMIQIIFVSDHPIDPESVLILCGKATIHCDPGHVLGADVALVASEQTDPECRYKYREDSCQKADLSSKLSNCLWNNSSCSVEPSGFCVIHSPSFLIPTFDHVAVFRNICVPGNHWNLCIQKLIKL